jgi:hypothetical protein
LADTETNDPVDEESGFPNAITSERTVAETIDCFLSQGTEAAMSKFN